MASITSTGVTVTISKRWIEGPAKHVLCKITFGDGALTLATANPQIPFPTYPSFGFKRAMDALTIYDHNDSSGIVWKYNATGNGLQGYNQGVSHSTGLVGTVATGDFTLADAQGTSIGAGLVGTGTLVSGVALELGLLRALTTAHAPAAQTLYAHAIGW